MLAPSFFGAKNAYTGSARTWHELKRELEHEQVKDGKELRMIEIFLDREDAPEGPLKFILEKQKEQVQKK